MQPSNDSLDGDHAVQVGALAPFRHPPFAMIWSASFVANFGAVIQTMAAAWVMSHLASSSTMVALVQTALSLPTMVLAPFTGVTADWFGRRPQMLAAQTIALLAGIALTLATLSGHLTATSLLAFTLLLGLAQAIYLPAWQSSIRDQVPPDLVPNAIGLNAVGLNAARCIGPAIGGVVLALIGPAAAFGFNSLGFFCVIIALVAWRPARTKHSGARPSMFASLHEGLQFALRHDDLRKTYGGCAAFAIFAVCPYAFLPLVARNLMDGTVTDYAIIQSSFGAGAVMAGIALPRLRRRASLHHLGFQSSLILGGATLVVGLNLHFALTSLCMFLIGVTWVVGFSVYNIATQIASPRSLIGRLLALYQTAISFGLAIGSAAWGALAHHVGIGTVMIFAGGLFILIQLCLLKPTRGADKR